MDIQAKRGLLEVLVLAILKQGDSYGYQLIRDVSAMIEISESTLYPVLRRLEAAGHVTARSTEHNGRLRKYYSITEQGIEKIHAFCEDQASFKRILDFISDVDKQQAQ